MAGGHQSETGEADVAQAAHLLPDDAIILAPSGRIYGKSLAALHAFAGKIGASAFWQTPPAARWPHYAPPNDADWRQKAIAAGALAGCQSTVIAVANMGRRDFELNGPQLPKAEAAA